MEKTNAQKIAELVERIRKMTALLDTGMQCQYEVDRLQEEKFKLVEKEKKSCRRTESH